MILFIILPAIVLLWLLYMCSNGNDRSWMKLPGPTGLPLFGSALFIDRLRPYDTFTKWSKIYGEVYSIRIFQQRVIVLNSVRSIKEALVTRGQDFGGRPKKFRSTYMSDNGNDIVSASVSPSWLTLKRITMRELNRFDPGHRRLELLTHEILNDFFQSLSQHEGQDFDPRNYVYDAIINTICMLLVGEKLDSDSKELRLFKQLERLITTSMNVGGEGSELDVLPWLRLFGNKTFKKLQLARDVRDELYEWVKERIDKDLQEGRACEGVLHGMFSQLNGGKEPELTANRVKLTIVNLLLGGTASTTAYLYLMINILVHYPQVQERLREEVDRIVGCDREVCLDDREAMPYFKAALLELFRFGSLSPLLIPHVAARDTFICGLEVPKDTWAFMNIRAVHHDESYWTDPYVFRPERFLDEKKELLSIDHPHRKSLVSFGGGPRSCPGESIARSRLFIFVSSLVQHFRLEPPECLASQGPCDPRTYDIGLVLEPKSFKFRCIKRKV